MARTRLRGIGIGGLRIAVEAPASWEWDWPDPHAAFRCLASDPDVYVSVEIGDADLPLRSPVVYGLANGTLEIGRCGGGSPGAESWGARVRDERGVLTARFDTRFRVVELIASPASTTALAGHHPLAHPLDELLVLHRLARDGGFLARGRLEIHDGRQTLVLGGDDSRVAVRTGRAGVRAFSTPWGRAPVPRSGRLDAVHAPRRGAPPGALRIDPACAPAALLPDVVAPIHCHELAVRAASAVEQVAAQVPVLALDLPEADPVVPFAWGRREAAFGFTAPVAP